MNTPENFPALWKSVEKDEQASLPKSALEKVGKIYQKALKEKNSPELIKALIHQMKYETVIDQDQFPGRLAEIEKYAAETPDVAEQSILYSVLAQLYYQYYQSNTRNINRRTAVTGYVPGDIREWTGNIFIQQITDNVKRSLEPEKILQETDVLKYEAILTKGQSSRNLRPTLYDFIIYQGIDVLTSISYSNPGQFFEQSKFSNPDYFSSVPDFIKMQIPAESYDLAPQILRLYQQLLTFRSGGANRDALLLADLDRLEFVYNHTANENRDEQYLGALSLLEKQYEKENSCVEILYKKALYYQQSGRREIMPLSDTMEKSDEGNAKAYQICIKGIQKYPRYERVNLLVNLKDQLTQSYANITSENTVYPGKSLDLKVSYQNINSLIIEIYKINAPVTVYENFWSMSGQYKKNGVLAERKTISLKNTFPYVGSDTVIQIPVKELGCYEYVIYSDKDKNSIANQQFSATRLSTVSRSYDNKYEFLVVDRLSGKPVEGAKINIYKIVKNKNQLMTTVVSGKDGLATKSYSKNDRLDAYNVSNGSDNALILSSTPWESNNNEVQDNIRKLDLMTDRSIYRPGQIVYFKGIAYELNKDASRVLVNQKYILSLKDTEGKEIASKEFHTSDLGSFSGEFVLPQNLLNGSFVIETDNLEGATTFRVEEYKRPDFDITFSPVKETYSFGDPVTVKGEAKTFSGVNVGNTMVRYRIVQRINRLWGWGRDGAGNQIAEGFVETNESGQFEISFRTEKRFDDKKRNNIVYTYEIQASMTDTKGETQQSVTSVPVGDISMRLEVNSLKGNLDKEHLPKVKILAFNLNYQEINCKGTYEIYSLKADQSLDKKLEDKDWKRDQLITSGHFTSGEMMNIPALLQANSGKYRIVMKANDDKGREISNESDFLLFSTKDKQPPVMTYEWVVTSKTSCAVGEKAEIIYGSSAKKVYVLYEIFKNDKKLESSRFELNNSVKKLEIPFLESYGDGVVVSLTFIKDAQFFNQNIQLQRKTPDKGLTLDMEVFRDKLLPGQSETWKLSVKGSDEKAVESEVLAGMYDKSLDKIYGHDWFFNPVYDVRITFPSLVEGNEFRTVHSQLYLPEEYSEAPQFNYDSFNWFGFSLYRPMLLRGAVLRESAVMSAEDATISANKMATESVFAAELPSPSSVTDASADFMLNEEGGGQEQPAQIRKNLNETAFFYPQLRTNKEGETVISFTVPESNTTWKFMALAHTKDLKYGQLIKEAVSQKKLMVSPNMPRLMRQGDQMTIAANIANLSDSTIDGKISIVFFDPVTEKQTIVVPQPEKDFRVEGGKTASASWTFNVPSDMDLTVCKVVARSAHFSDGEQHLLPVLPNRMMVTESMPLNISGKGSKKFTLNKLVNNQSKTLENYRLTLEFAGNPAWYAVQALPSLTSPVNDNVISWFAAYYANTLASSIANSTPKIRQVIDTWTKQGGTKETLISNLEKNQELKAVLLEETPWVMEACNETEQKQRLSLLFDINRNNNLSTTAIGKLKDMQLQDGGWAWYKGMYSNISITQWILYGMGQLSLLGATDYPEDVKNMQKEALGFIDKEFVKHFENLKKFDSNWQKKATVSTYELEYLFVRGLYAEPVSPETNEAIAFYFAIAEKNWAKIPDLYARAITAIIMQKNGKTNIAGSILKSLREHASNKEDLGMFWPNNNTQAFMFQSATAVHTFIMEAFEKVGSTRKELDEMKLWLLKQKQTQEWESTPATVNAISVLLRTGDNWLENEGRVEIGLGNTQVETGSREAGTGYFKKTYEAEVISPGMGKVSVVKSDDGPAWGALYWQYYEQLDKITKAKTGLHVEKMLFVEKISGSGKTLVPVTSTNPLKIGDKVIVRLTIRNDRDMEYVMLKDMRAACFEPAEQLSGTKWRESTVYYQTTKDASTNFYFYNLPKGTYVFEYPVYVTRPGEYSNGITTIQCMYAPEFLSNTEGIKISVK